MLMKDQWLIEPTDQPMSGLQRANVFGLPRNVKTAAIDSYSIH
jgi:hypothetical protein